MPKATKLFKSCIAQEGEPETKPMKVRDLYQRDLMQATFSRSMLEQLSESPPTCAQFLLTLEYFPVALSTHWKDQPTRFPWAKWLGTALKHKLRIMSWPSHLAAPGPRFNFKQFLLPQLTELVAAKVKIESWTYGAHSLPVTSPIYSS